MAVKPSQTMRAYNRTFFTALRQAKFYLLWQPSAAGICEPLAARVHKGVGCRSPRGIVLYSGTLVISGYSMALSTLAEN